MMPSVSALTHTFLSLTTHGQLDQVDGLLIK